MKLLPKILRNLSCSSKKSLGNIRDIIIDNVHSKFYQKFDDIDSPLQRAESDILFIGQSPKYLMESAGMILIAIIAFFLAKDSKSFDQALPVLGSHGIISSKIVAACATNLFWA